MKHQSSRKFNIFNIILTIMMLFSMLAVNPARGVEASVLQPEGDAPQNQQVDLAEMLNPDGSLNLEAGYQGSFDLADWNVSLDPQHGPLFSSADSASQINAQSTGIPGSGEWGELGSGAGALNDDVYAIAVSGTDVYVGGRFTNAGGDYDADCVARWDSLNNKWLNLGHNGYFNGVLDETYLETLGTSCAVYSLAVDGTDVYVGGLFNVTDRKVAKATASNFARYNTITGSWNGLGDDGSGGTAINSVVTSIAIDGDSVYVGGYFTNVSSIPEADYIAKWDKVSQTWFALGSDGAEDGALNLRVRAVDVDTSGNLYIGGDFTDAAGLAEADHIAKWDGSTWSALGNAGAGIGAIGNIVNAILVDGSDVYAGGEFENAGGLTSADRVARWDTTTSSWNNIGIGYPIGTSGENDGAITQSVYSLLIQGGNLYAGGSISYVYNGTTLINSADMVAMWDGTDWSALGDDGAGEGSLKSGAVHALGAVTDVIYAGGTFTHIVTDGSTPIPAQSIAQFSTTWSTLGSATYSAVNQRVKAIALDGTDVYLGGDFQNAAGIPAADYIVKWNSYSGTWSALGSDNSGNGSLDGFVSAILVHGSNLYVAGGFYDPLNGNNHTYAKYLARWDGANWNRVGDNGSGGSPINNRVYALASNGSKLYAGGNFTDITNKGVIIPEADRIAVFDMLTSDWSAMGDNSAGDSAFDWGTVYAIALDGPDVYVGGNFYIPGITRNLARWDGSTWSALSYFNELSWGTVRAIAVSGSNVYVGGDFQDAGGVAEADYVANWDTLTDTWSALGNNGAGDGAINSPVFAMTAYGDNLIIGGQFFNAGNVDEADKVAMWNGSSWSNLGTAGQVQDGSFLSHTQGPDKDGTRILALALGHEDALYAGGEFLDVESNDTTLYYADYVAVYGITDIAPWVQSVYRLDPNPNNTTSVDYQVWFSEPVYALDATWDLALTVSGLTGASITDIQPASGYNSLYTVMVDTGSGDGTLRLDVTGDSTDDLGGNTPAPFTEGEVYDIDKTAPSVSAIARQNASSTSSANVDYLVTFSEPVNGVDASDFSLTKTGSITGYGVTGVSGSDDTYTVTVNTGKYNGTLRLDVNASGTGILDLAGIDLDGGFTSGEVYTITKTYTLTVKSQPKYDGWVLESGEFTNKGGTKNNLGKILFLGDNAQDKQYRAILSFGTAGIPDGAVITRVILKVKKAGVVGKNPMVTHNSLVVDVKKGKFYTLPALQITDFQAKAGKNKIGKFPNKLYPGNWYRSVLYKGAYDYDYINKMGRTQLRLRFLLDDDNDNVADILKLYSGNAILANRPQLIVRYYVP